MATPQPILPPEERIKLRPSTIFPLVGGRATWRQEHLRPILATLVAGLLLFKVPLPVNGLIPAVHYLIPWISPKLTADYELNQAWQVMLILGIYMAFLICYYANRICARAKPAWLIAVVGLFTFLLLNSFFWSYWYILFYNVLPAAHWQDKTEPVLVQLAGYWFGTGLCEEGFKALPLFVLIALGAILAKPVKNRIGLLEPLDGIVLGVASGCGFFLNETLGQYVLKTMIEVGKNLSRHNIYASGSEAFQGLTLLLARGLPDIAEHSAWSGLFGYFIGLSVLRPRMAIFLLPLGWFSSAALHAGWDGIGVVTNSDVVGTGLTLLVGLLSYLLLAGAIFKAREISPRLRHRHATAVVPQAPSAPADLAPATAPVPTTDASGQT